MSETSKVPDAIRTAPDPVKAALKQFLVRLGCMGLTPAPCVKHIHTGITEHFARRWTIDAYIPGLDMAVGFNVCFKDDVAVTQVACFGSNEQDVLRMEAKFADLITEAPHPPL